ncbi:hypothetical protein N7495_001017 [Penicillium taxi]|uniref:uncharacterized protein n=1 Tax=Penicillium taxi TaxID=168475 RepID=UPI00254551C2|nr:uncharacterized protein N7495_001017 [Penicillium taxi]KAJ5908335.1 hypothetical protein N7495_001017 [Penicillium taxi]
MVILKLLPLLLYIGISAAYAAQQAPDIVGPRQRTHRVKILPPSSVHESKPNQLFKRQDARSSVFMEDALKGAQAWKKYQSTLSSGRIGSTSVEVPLVLNDEHTGIGWEINAKGYSVPVAVKNRPGWRYWKTESPVDNELLITLARTIGVRAHDLDLQEVTANDWAQPKFQQTASFDCNRGIAIVSLSYFEVSVVNEDDEIHTIRSQYRWSDVIWALWSAVCPHQKANLKYFVRDSIGNGVSRSVMREAATAAGHYNKDDLSVNNNQATTWTTTKLEMPIDEENFHSCDAAAGDCDFYAVVHTPNAIGILYLAMAHANELACTSVAKITGISFYVNEDEGDSEDKGEDEDEGDDEDMDSNDGDAMESETESEDIVWYSVIELEEFCGS